MNNDIMKASSTNVFNKIGKMIWKGICAFFDSPISMVVVIFLFGWGVYSFMTWFENYKSPKGDYVLVYKVYYTPTNIKEYTIRHDRPIEVGCSNGSNYVRKHGDGRVIETSAPIEVVKYVNYQKNE